MRSTATRRLKPCRELYPTTLLHLYGSPAWPSCKRTQMRGLFRAHYPVIYFTSVLQVAMNLLNIVFDVECLIGRKFGDREVQAGMEASLQGRQ
jgi:hypothetical protein